MKALVRAMGSGIILSDGEVSLWRLDGGS